MQDAKPPTFSDIVAVCWDIEAVGTDVIGIGVAVMDVAQNHILDKKLIKGYYPSRPMDKRTWDEFWHKHQDVLAFLTAEEEDGPTFEENQSRMVRELLDFVAEAERTAKRANKQFHIVSDNTTFDIGLVNRMIERYHDEKFQFPYSPLAYSEGTFRYMGRVFDLMSMERSLLCLYAPEWAKTQEWGYTEKVRELWGIPAPSIAHDHNPVNDAIFQLYEYQNLLYILDGKYELASAKC